MSESYLGEIRMFAGSFAPDGWLFCDGQTLSISQYPTLYGLIGTTYGGDGQTNFNLPDLRGRVPIHQGTLQVPGGGTYVRGQSGGAERVTLTEQQIPAHNHVWQAGSGNTVTDPTGRVLAGGTGTATASAQLAAMTRRQVCFTCTTPMRAAMPITSSGLGRRARAGCRLLATGTARWVR